MAVLSNKYSENIVMLSMINTSETPGNTRETLGYR